MWSTTGHAGLQRRPHSCTSQRAQLRLPKGFARFGIQRCSRCQLVPPSAQTLEAPLQSIRADDTPEDRGPSTSGRDQNGSDFSVIAVPGRKGQGSITLAHPKYKVITGMWHPTKNEGKLPQDFKHRGGKKVHLQCHGCPSCGRVHEWSARAIDLTQYGGQIVCPNCNSRAGKFCECRSIVNTPELLTEWAPENGDPSQFSRYMGRKFTWICYNCSQKYGARARDRYIKGAGCPQCSRRRWERCGSLEDVRPDLFKEWDVGKNGGPPKKITCGSQRKVWWRCSKCDHNWQSSVQSRARRGYRCPSSSCIKENRCTNRPQPAVQVQ